MRVLVLGAGFGGLELTTRLSEELGDSIDIVLIDQAEGFVFGFSKLEVMFGRALPESVRHPYRDVVKPGVQFVQAEIRSIDPVAKRVDTDAGPFEADILVVALGADLHPDATPGLVEGGNEFYTVAGAFALRQILAEFEGGRVIVGVTSTPFKCPPAPSETALLVHDHLTASGQRGRVDDLAGHAPGRAHPAVTGGLGGAAGGLRGAWHRLVPRAARPRARPGPQGRHPQRRQRDALRPVPRRAGAPRACRGRGVGDDRRRMDPGRSPDPGDELPGGLRRRRRDQRRDAEGRRLRRRPGGGRRRRDQRRHPRHRRRHPLRRPRHVLPRVRSRPGRPGRRHVPQRAGATSATLEGPSQELAADKVEFGSTRIERWFGRTWPER